MIFEVPMDHFPVNSVRCDRKQPNLRLQTSSCPEQKMICSMQQSLQKGPSVATEPMSQKRPLTANPNTRRPIPPLLKRAMTSPSLPVGNLSSTLLSRLSPTISRTSSITNIINLSRVVSTVSLNAA
ncbi:hypothetical protein WR25_20199 [Diploscapter pachys]|uniref:Uncharacterized protein n=1 Tax=Diploscapter pachys TaxID=2018661 RepID=A0A2A2JTT0_9BILA|nr:hypothetical protein WR25_20199 [Diploscapter pachys]